MQMRARDVLVFKFQCISCAFCSWQAVHVHKCKFSFAMATDEVSSGNFHGNFVGIRSESLDYIGTQRFCYRVLHSWVAAFCKSGVSCFPLRSIRNESLQIENSTLKGSRCCIRHIGYCLVPNRRTGLRCSRNSWKKVIKKGIEAQAAL